MATKQVTQLKVSEQDVPTEPTAFDEFVDYEKKALQEFGRAFAALLPEGVRKHGDSAVKEMVEGYRVLFNSTLDDIVKLVEKAKIEEKEPDKKSKVPVQ